MSTTWTRAAGAICTDALQMMGVSPPGQSVCPEDMQSALDALNAVLKELPLYGYSWPKLSADTSLTWIGQTFTLPADFYGYPRVWADGQPLIEMTAAVWNALTDKDETGATATHFYISPGNVLYVYPNPTSDPVLTLQYQRLVNDAAQLSGVDMPQFWLNTLGYGVANELLLKFSIPEALGQRIEKRWIDKRERALKNSVSSAPISFGVEDIRIPDPSNWQAPAPIPDGFDGGSSS